MILHTQLVAAGNPTSYDGTRVLGTIDIKPGKFPPDYEFFVTCYLQMVVQIGVTIDGLEGFGRGWAEVAISKYTINDNPPNEGNWQHLLVTNLTSVTFSLYASGANASAAGFVLPYPPTTSPWPVFRHDLRRTGLSPIDTSTNSGKQKWAFPTGASVESSPVIGGDGTIYFGSDDGNLYAVNPDGTLKWKSAIGAALPFNKSTPAVGIDGTIYFAAENDQVTAGNLYAVNPANGSVRWALPTGGAGNISSPVIGRDGTIYFRRQEPLCGEPRWHAKVSR
jgi:hypothetical protein